MRRAGSSFDRQSLCSQLAVILEPAKEALKALSKTKGVSAAIPEPVARVTAASSKLAEFLAYVLSTDIESASLTEVEEARDALVAATEAHSTSTERFCGVGGTGAAAGANAATAANEEGNSAGGSGAGSAQQGAASGNGAGNGDGAGNGEEVALQHIQVIDKFVMSFTVAVNVAAVQAYRCGAPACGGALHVLSVAVLCSVDCRRAESLQLLDFLVETYAELGTTVPVMTNQAREAAGRGQETSTHYALLLEQMAVAVRMLCDTKANHVQVGCQCVCVLGLSRGDETVRVGSDRCGRCCH